MTQLDPITPEEGIRINKALFDGDADQAFELLAVYLKRNCLKLSDHVLRIYLDEELFDCFTGTVAGKDRHRLS